MEGISYQNAYICMNAEQTKVFEAFTDIRLAEASWKLSYHKITSNLIFEKTIDGSVKVMHDDVCVGCIVVGISHSPLSVVSHL